MLSKKIKKELEKAFSDIQVNLENNYKDLAIDARNNAEKLINEYKESGILNEKQYDKYVKKLESYKARMVGYHH